MEVLVQLAIDASAIIAKSPEAAEEGFGLNFNILQTNLLNLAIIIGILFYFGRKFLGGMLEARRSQIESAIVDAERRKKEAASALAEQQQKLAQAQTEAAQIIAQAQQNAESARQAILAQAEKDVERMQANAAQDLDSQRERTLRELRQRVAAMAMEQVEVRLKSDLSDSTKQQLVDRSIAMLGGNS